MPGYYDRVVATACSVPGGFGFFHWDMYSFWSGSHSVDVTDANIDIPTWLSIAGFEIPPNAVALRIMVTLEITSFPPAGFFGRYEIKSAALPALRLSMVTGDDPGGIEKTAFLDYPITADPDLLESVQMQTPVVNGLTKTLHLVGWWEG